LIPINDMKKKIQISSEARDACSNGDLIICARSEARGFDNRIEISIERSKAFINAGADMIFTDGLKTLMSLN